MPSSRALAQGWIACQARETRSPFTAGRLPWMTPQARANELPPASAGRVTPRAHSRGDTGSHDAPWSFARQACRAGNGSRRIRYRGSRIHRTRRRTSSFPAKTRAQRDGEAWQGAQAFRTPADADRPSSPSRPRCAILTDRGSHRRCVHLLASRNDHPIVWQIMRDAAVLAGSPCARFASARWRPPSAPPGSARAATRQADGMRAGDHPVRRRRHRR